MSLIAELKRRNVIRMAGLYLVGAWLVVQVAGTLLPVFEAPAWVMKTLVGLLAVGFVPALVFSWVFELTPDGIKRDAEVKPEESIAPQTARRMDRMITVALALALAYFAFDKFVLAPRREAAIAAATQKQDTSPPATKPGDAAGERSIAVLPFENLSADKENEYFASGMQDMILTKLAAIRELKVISRTSTEKYASHPDDLKTIAQQLGVATILEGSVQKSGNSVLINVQLIDAASDRHVWADAYTRTLDNIFGVEGEVAQKVADALQAKLTSAESASVASVPTQNAAAYEWFLKAEYQSERARQTWQDETYRAAEADFRRALDLDPGFALAEARLALSQLSRHWFATHLTPAELTAVKASIDRALALAPELPDAHLALAFYYYWGFRQYDAATTEFDRTLQLSPNRVEAVSGHAYVARRIARIPQSLTYFEQALRLSPRDARLLGESGWTYVLLRRYADADRQLRQALAITPADANFMDALLKTRLFGFGDVEGARELLRNPPDWRIVGQNAIAGDVFLLVNPRAYVHVFDRRFTDALRAWEDAPTSNEEERRTGRVARAAIRVVAGDGKSAQADCAQLEPQLTAELAREPDSLALLQQVSWVDVCLGRNAQALAAAQKAVDVLPIGKDSYFGAYELVGLAEIAAHAGAPERAVDVIRQLQAMPAGSVMSPTRLKLDPVWDPLREDPRFRKLMTDAEAAQASGSAP